MFNNYFSLIVLLLLTLCSCNIKKSDSQTDEEKLLALAKVYGYVKYFHPSDDASNIDWDSFGIFASQRVLESEDLKSTLNELFLPIAPQIKVNQFKQKPQVSERVEVDSLKSIFWQHIGHGQGSVGSVYKSARLNKKARVLPSSTNDYSGIGKGVSIDNLKGKKITLSALLRPKSDYNGRPSVRIHLKRKNQPWREIHSSGQPLVVNLWNRHSISTIIPEDIELIRIHVWSVGLAGSIDIDDVNLSYGDQNKSLISNEFDSSQILDDEWNPWGDNQTLNIINTKENSFLKISRTKGDLKAIEPIFKIPKTIQGTIKEKIGEQLLVTVPLVLSNDGAKSHSDRREYTELINAIDSVSLTNINFSNTHLRNVNIIKVWNTMKHFNPNLNLNKIDWDNQFLMAMSKSKKDITREDHINTLKIMVAPVMDSHLKVYHSSDKEHFPPLMWEMIEGNLIVTKVLDSTLNISTGDVITKVNDLNVKEHWEYSLLKAQGATETRKKLKAIEESLSGLKNSKLKLTIQRENEILDLELTRTLSSRAFKRSLGSRRDTFSELEKGVYYIDLSKIKWADLESRLEKISRGKAVIFDLRGYLAWGNINIASHLTRDSIHGVKTYVPHILYPNQESVTFKEAYHNTFIAKEPFISARKIFISNSSALSYSEDLLNLVEYYELADIVGEQTAGSTGNVNILKLLDGISMPWSGMKVLRQDGSPFHGRGILPSHPVRKRLNAVKNSKDEYLEYALQLISEG